MRRFSFRLEPLLKYRSDLEEKALTEQSLAQKIYLEQLGVLDAIRGDLDGAMEAGSGSSDENSDPAADCLARSLYIGHLTECRDRQEEAVERSLDQLEEKRRAAIEARREKIVLEKLREKLYRKYEYDLIRWEAKLTDDQCTVLTYRKSAEK